MVCVFHIKVNKRGGRFLGMYGTEISSGIYAVNLAVTIVESLVKVLTAHECHGRIVKFSKHSVEPEICVF